VKGNRAKHDERILFKGSKAGATHIWTSGTGEFPTFPIAEAGGVHKMMMDIEVPAIAAGDFADWHDTYPGQYVSPGATQFELLRYGGPLDTAQNLHGKGNVILTELFVLAGAGITGAAPPTQASGNANFTFITAGGFLAAWTRTAVIPAAANGLLVPATSTPIVFGADFGPSTLVLTLEAVTQPITAGRIRVVGLFVEI
jgi:hypothetical protein